MKEHTGFGIVLGLIVVGIPVFVTALHPEYVLALLAYVVLIEVIFTAIGKRGK